MTNTEAATLLEALAKHLRTMAEYPFGGALLAIPPTGNPVDAILSTSAPDTALFWATVEGKIEIAKAEIEAAVNPYGRR